MNLIDTYGLYFFKPRAFSFIFALGPKLIQTKGDHEENSLFG